MPRVHLFESLRGLLAVWVIVHHAVLTSGLDSDRWPFPLSLFGQGGYAVDVFIILSGFVIFFLLDNETETYGRFITRRVFRLYPVYLTSLLVSAPLIPFYLSTLKALPWWHPHTSLRIQHFSDTLQYYWAHFFSHVLMLHGLVPDRLLPSSDYAFVGPSWSISLEWQFYLVAPLFYLCISGKKIGRLALLIALLFLLRGFYPGGPGFLPLKAEFFFTGIAAYYGYRFVVRHREVLESSALLVAALPFLFTLFWISSVPMVLFSAVYSIVLATVLMPGSRVVKATLWLFERKSLLYAGRISYCLYMTHMVILLAWAHFLIPFFKNQAAFFVTLLGAVLISTFLVSTLVSRYIEYPGIAWGKRLTK